MLRGCWKWGLRFFRRRPTKQETVGLEFELCGTCIHLRAMLDTGCHLTDPITCMPVLVVSLTDAGSRLPPEVRQFLASWFAGGDKTDPPAGAQLRLIPCSTAAQRSLLPALRCAISGLSPRPACCSWGVLPLHLRRNLSVIPNMRLCMAAIFYKIYYEGRYEP